jgi:hypothetical protein
MARRKLLVAAISVRRPCRRSISAPPIHEVRERLAAFVSLDLAGDEGGDRFAQR